MEILFTKNLNNLLTNEKKFIKTFGGVHILQKTHKRIFDLRDAPCLYEVKLGTPHSIKNLSRDALFGIYIDRQIRLVIWGYLPDEISNSITCIEEQRRLKDPRSITHIFVDITKHYEGYYGIAHGPLMPTMKPW